jgi:hypothetical protein
MTHNPEDSASYGKWTRSDDSKLRKMYNDGKSRGEIARALKRSLGSISGRCKKLGIQKSTRNTYTPKSVESPQFQDVTQLCINFSWVAVLNNDGSPYLFPQPVMSSFPETAKKGVYRWKAISPDETTIQYIGQSKDVFNSRIRFYLNPIGSSSPTDQRIHCRLRSLHKLGYQISLELLSYAVAFPDGVVIQKNDFLDTSRHFLEHIMIVGHKHIKTELLNL